MQMVVSSFTKKKNPINYYTVIISSVGLYSFSQENWQTYEGHEDLMKIQKLKRYAFLKEQIKYNFRIQEGGERSQRDKTLWRKGEKRTEVSSPDRKSETKYKMLELYSFWDRVHTWWRVRVRRETSEEDRGFLLPLKRGRKRKGKGEAIERERERKLKEDRSEMKRSKSCKIHS